MDRRKIIPPLALLMGIGIFVVLGAWAYRVYRSGTSASLTTRPQLDPAPTVNPQVTDAEPTIDLRQYKTYTNKTFAITLAYPKDWFGPEVYEYPDGFRFEVGTDTVYPYGTAIEDRVYTKENNYFITFQYAKKPEDQTVEQYKSSQPWINQGLAYLLLADGESKSDSRSLVTRVKSVRVGDYSGIEYISTLSSTAQTDMVYSREVLLMDSRFNTIRITGTPDRVTVRDKQNWKSFYQAIDQANLPAFEHFVTSADI